MSFIRPEVQDILIRWREVIFGGSIIALGTYWSFSAGPILRWVAVLMIIGGGAIMWEGVRRARLPRGGGGSGVVQVTERQITYLAAQQGGIVSVNDLTRVEIQTSPSGFSWLFHAPGQPPLRIPGDAEGAEALYDALAALAGANLEAIAQASTSTRRDIFLIWQKDRRSLH